MNDTDSRPAVVGQVEPSVRPLPEWEDPSVQAAYEVLCDLAEPPDGEHWEGFVARRIVAALRDLEQR